MEAYAASAGTLREHLRKRASLGLGRALRHGRYCVMAWGISIRIATGQAPSIASARLNGAVASVPAVWPMKPSKVSEWLEQYRDKAFLGRVEERRFKLVLLRSTRQGYVRRGNSVVILGTVEDQAVRALLRPPIFNLVFAILLTLAISAAFVLSFYGPSSTPAVHWLLATLLVVPILALTWAFFAEAREAEQTLRRVLVESAPRT